MSYLAETFKKRFSAVVAAWGTHESLAQKSGVSRATMTRWLAGENVPDLDQVDAVSKALGKKPEDLLFSEAEDLPVAWREIIRRVGSIDQAQVPAIIAGIQGILASLRLDEADRISKNSKKLSRTPES